MKALQIMRHLVHSTNKGKCYRLTISYLRQPILIPMGTILGEEIQNQVYKLNNNLVQ